VSSVRTARARKLLAFETTRVATKERELAAARRALAEVEAVLVRAVAEAREAESRWLDDETSTELLEQASEHRCSLETRVSSARQRVAKAAAEVKAREAAAIVARMAERRFEILIDGFAAADDARARKAERKSGDEHAARKAGTS